MSYCGPCRHCGYAHATWVRCGSCGALDARGPNPFVPTDTLHGPPSPRGPTAAQELSFLHPTEKYGEFEARILAHVAYETAEPRWYCSRLTVELVRRGLVEPGYSHSSRLTDAGEERLRLLRRDWAEVLLPRPSTDDVFGPGNNPRSAW